MLEGTAADRTRQREFAVNRRTPSWQHKTITTAPTVEGKRTFTIFSAMDRFGDQVVPHRVTNITDVLGPVT
jgi:hypothetical protein